MPRKPRFFLPGVPAHVIQRGHGCGPVFLGDDDRRDYLQQLYVAARRHGCRIHAYVLMPNHIHLLATPESSGALSRTLQYLGRRYVPEFNQRHGRSGTLWEGRFKAALIQSDSHLLACQRYIELNPVRAGLCASAGRYLWSSFRYNGFGEADPVITPHALYLRLDEDADTRRRAYRRLFAQPPAEDEFAELRACLQSGTPLGDAEFRRGIEQILGIEVGYARRGRPAKAAVASAGGGKPRD